MRSLEDIVQEVKDRNPIEDVIAEDGFRLPGRGMYLKSPKQGGLVVNTHAQLYYWNARAEHGDVISWVEHRKGTDFKGAIEILCRRAGLPEPEWGHEDPKVRMAAQAKANVLDVATEMFHKWLMASEEAMEFVKGRGWSIEAGSDEDGEQAPEAATAMKARLGYSGTGSREERQELEGELVGRAGIDPSNPDPVVVAVMGMGGKEKIAKWSALRQIELKPDWIDDGYIPGMLGRKRLIYPHMINGRVRYMSGRSIEEKFHYNPPMVLMGERMPYFNHVYRQKGDEVVIVEGQGDAVSLGQLGVEAVALNGVAPNESLVEALKHHKVKYVGTDSDKVGIQNSQRLGELIGPMTRLVNWGFWNHTWTDQSGDSHFVKDANDLLRALQQAEGMP